MPQRRFVTPGCCAEVAHTNAVHLRFPPVDARSLTYAAVPDWHCWSWDPALQLSHHAPAAFCPHCGTPVPPVVPVTPPGPVCADAGDTGHCDACRERLRECRCLPPEFAFGPGPRPAEEEDAP